MRYIFYVVSAQSYALMLAVGGYIMNRDARSVLARVPERPRQKA